MIQTVAWHLCGSYERSPTIVLSAVLMIVQYCGGQLQTNEDQIEKRLHFQLHSIDIYNNAKSLPITSSNYKQ